MSKLAKGAIYLSLSAFLFMLSGYIANIWLGRHFGPKVYGQYGVIIALISLINIMQTSGLPQALAKFVAENPKEKDGILKSALNIQIISTLSVALLFAAFAPTIATLLKDKELVKYLRLSALVFPLYGIYSVYVGYYNGLHEFKHQAKLNGIYAVAKAFGIILLSLIFKLYGAIAAFIIAPVFALIFGFYLPSKNSRRFSRRSLIVFALPIIIFSLATTLFLSLDLLFVKSLLSNDKPATGFYIAAQNIALVIYFCMSAASSVILPSISANLALGLSNKVAILIRNSLRYMLMILAPIAAIMAATCSQLIKIIYSDKYSNGAPALKILLIAYVLLAIFALFSNILNGGSRPYIPVKAAIPGLLATGTLCSLLIPKYGIIGAAIATLSGVCISVIICGIFIWKIFRFNYPFMSILKILLLSLLLYAIASWFNANLIELPVMYLILTIIYIAALILFNELTAEDKTQILNLLPKRANSSR
jgi:stage V sporulation protein B